jgi:radical SAM superfamily enzyme YgiQ (UPF0313 family)
MEAIYDRIIKLREEDGLDVRFVIQVDTLCHRIPGFIEKSRRAGVTRVFIGLENINPANLLAAQKRQNKLTEYRGMLLAWKASGIMTFAGYIIGFPNDTPESISDDIKIIQQELPIDAVEFFVLTPLPGSEDHKVLAANGIDMDRDFNAYSLRTSLLTTRRCRVARGKIAIARHGRSSTARTIWRRFCDALTRAALICVALLSCCCGSQ